MNRFFGIIAGIGVGTIIALGAVGIVQSTEAEYVGIPDESLIGPYLL